MSNNKTPAPFAWIASVATLGVIVAAQCLPRGNHPILRVTGVLALFLATVFVFWPFHLLAKHGAIGKKQPYMQTTTVVERGLYAITRHPQYLGYALLACGFALLSQHWVSCLLAAIGVICFYVQAVHEERSCLARLGRPYAQYCQRVPRFNAILGLARFLMGRSGGSK